MMRTFSAMMCLFIAASGNAQINAGLFRFPDVSKTQIVFSYANDLWLIPKEGGTATRLSSPPGTETFPKFSPDGSTIAFTGNYDGNPDVYLLPVNGGVPARLTEHGMNDRVVDWHPDGKHILFASGRESGKARFNQFYTVSTSGGPVSKLPLAYAELGSYSEDGKQMALTFETQVGRNWKRYSGGNRGQIHIFNFETLASENISGYADPGDEFPMWRNGFIYFLSDRGTEKRMNLWRYDLSSKAFQQLTHFTDYDAHYPSMGPDDIVFEAGGKLYLFSLAEQKERAVPVTVITDRATMKEKNISAEKYIQHLNPSPDGKRVVVEARGDIFSVPAEDGFVKNLTQSSGSNERFPAWSPDGKTIAYFSDESGEYELYLLQPATGNTPKKMTSYGPGFRYNIFWSPDSKKLVFVDKAMRINLLDAGTGKTIVIDRGLRWSEGSLQYFRGSWSADSRYFAYPRDLENAHNAIFIYDDKNDRLTQATSGFYDCGNPCFDVDGKYLYLVTSQSFQPSYSDVDNSFIYTNSLKIAAVSLQKTTPSILFAKNDTVSVKKDEEEKKEEPKNDKKEKKAGDQKEDKKPANREVNIDFDGFESRMVLLPVSAGNYGQLASVKGKIIFIKRPSAGIEGPSGLRYFDIDKREEKTILDNVDGFELTADGSKILVATSNGSGMINVAEGQKLEKPLRLSEMRMTVDPAREWKQIFTEVWRLERDYFYDSSMHGVDWNLVKERYLKMLEGAVTREDVDFIIGEMIGELNASHTYHGGGDMEMPKSEAVGYLGIDWQPDGNFYKIKKIIRGAGWDIEAQSPFDGSGSKIKEGDYILAVNGVPVTTASEPFAQFAGLSNRTVEITYNSAPSFTGAKTTVIKTLDNEYRLRHLAWIESNRKRVDETSNGDVGYIYVPSTGIDGQTELMRQFSAQWNKKALIIDERFNNGGQIPDRFIEMLNRTPLAFWAIRDGQAWTWPPYAHFGPQVMMINGWSGSGGDAFPDYFRKKGLGPIIGTRTWGGLIGISGAPPLIDNGDVTVPTFRMYNPDGTWFKEGHGVDPDIVVNEDLTALAKGIDPQLEKAIETAKKLIKEKGYTIPARPAPEKR